MKRTNLSLTLTILCITFLSSCSTNGNSDLLADAKSAQREIAFRNKVIAEKIDAIPSWVLSPPQPDSQAIYAVGIGESDTLQISVKKAMLEAEFGLAKKLRQELAGSERQYTTDDSTKSVNRFEALIDKLVLETPIVGYTIKQQIIKPMDGKYQTFVLLRLPYDQYNDVLQANRAKETRNEMKAAFSDLEKRLDKKKAENTEIEESETKNEQQNKQDAR